MSAQSHAAFDHDVLVERIPGEHLARCHTTGADPALFRTADARVIRRAKAICHRCPIRAGCLAYALRLHPTGTVWGGEWFGAFGRPTATLPSLQRRAVRGVDRITFEQRRIVAQAARTYGWERGAGDILGVRCPRCRDIVSAEWGAGTDTGGSIERAMISHLDGDCGVEAC